MFVLVENDSITKTLSTSKGITIGENQYPRAIYSSWSTAEREAIGIYEVVFDNSNQKDGKYYNNTNQSFAFADGKVTASFGSATAKSLADTLWTQADSDNGDLPSDKSVGDVKTEGLKTKKIRHVKKEAANILAETDWYIVRKADADTDVPSAITTYRAAVRTKAAAMETLITNASNTPAIETLYIRVNTADEGDPVVMERPLGEFPVLGS